MRHRVLFVLAGAGAVLGIVAAFVYSRGKAAEPPVFNPATNPYAAGIYANGIVESYQANGENINLYPEISGQIAEIPVAEGQAVSKGDVLVKIDGRDQQAVVEQLKAQAEAARTQAQALKAQPRKEVLEVARAQADAAAASLKNVQDQLAKVSGRIA